MSFVQKELQSLHSGSNNYRFDFLHDALNYATAIFWFLAYLTILLKVHRDKSALGISLQSLFALFLSELNNVILQILLSFSYSFTLGKAFWACDVSTTLLSFLAWWYIFNFYYSSYERDRDTFGLKFCKLVLDPKKARAVYPLFVYLVALILTIPLFLLRRTRLSVVFSLYECMDDTLLAIALIPQLYMFYNKRPRKVSNLLGDFVVLLFMARMCALIYWLSYPLFHPGSVPSRGLHIGTEILNIIILADFLYHFAKAKYRRESDISLPI
eukprot:GHVR01150885.1.p1 GENE.GHVR01150885.1~~GHVR01150885.1.p1  ORF type:complete len:270 (-),score=25.46 GHVR01150885.1:18-827(-)